jgi:hypothetical protein
MNIDFKDLRSPLVGDDDTTQDRRTELEAHWSHQSPSFMSGVRASPASSRRFLALQIFNPSSLVTSPRPYLITSMCALAGDDHFIVVPCLARAKTPAHRYTFLET